MFLCDFNAKVGKAREILTVGPFGLGQRNDCADRLIEFSKANKLFITNAWYSLPKHRLYTWTRPDNSVRNQIAYILVLIRFRNGMKQVKTYPGPDCCTDHNPVVMDMSVRLKKLKKTKRTNRIDFDRLITDENKRLEYLVETEN